MTFRMCMLSECTGVLYTWPPVGNFRLLPSAHQLVQWNICFTRCVATLLSGALSTLLRLTAEGVVGVKEDWIVGAEWDVGGQLDKK